MNLDRQALETWPSFTTKTGIRRGSDSMTSDDLLLTFGGCHACWAASERENMGRN